MKKIILIIGGLMLCVAYGFGQSAKERAETMAAEFNKEKHKHKEKEGVVKEKHKTVEARPDIRKDITSYAGKYEMQGLDQFFILNLTPDNNWEGEFVGNTSGKTVTTARLKNIKIEDALLTGTVTTDQGKTEPFEAVFINRFVNGEPANGIGIKHVLALSNGFLVDRAFYKRIEL